MLSECESLEDLDVSSFDTSKADTLGMFDGMDEND